MNDDRHHKHFHQIDKNLSGFSISSRKAIIDDLLDEDEKVMIWMLNDQCNLNCSYCHHKTTEANQNHYTHEFIIDQFNRDEITWFINITGGEPFLYKEFIDLAKRLTENHFLSVNTNLTSNIDKFIAEISPERIVGINASYHLEELRKFPDLKKQYLSNFNTLKEKGFNIMASIVGFPPFLKMIDNTVQELKSHGINPIGLRNFMGQFEDKKYPESYTMNEIDILKKYQLKILELDLMQQYIDMKGRPCQAGTKYFLMNSSGDLYRCTSDGEALGNFFKNNYKILSPSSACKVFPALCSFECLLSSRRKNNIISRIFNP